MNTIRQQCFLLRTLISDVAANKESIAAVKQQIEADMKIVIQQGHVTYATCDMLFEALCFSYFSDLFNESDFYVMRYFINMFMPFYEAGLLQLKNSSRVIPNMYLHRFLTARAQAKVHGHQTLATRTSVPKALPKPQSLKPAKVTMPFYKAAAVNRLPLKRSLDDFLAADVLIGLARCNA